MKNIKEVFIKNNVFYLYLLIGLLQILVGIFLYIHTNKPFLITIGTLTIILAYWYIKNPSIILYAYHFETKFAPIFKRHFILYSEVKTVKLIKNFCIINYSHENQLKIMKFNINDFLTKDINNLKKRIKNSKNLKKTSKTKK